MRTITRVICCGVALAWMYSATAEEEAVEQASTAEGEVADVAPSAEGGTGPSAPTGGNSRVLAQAAAAAATGGTSAGTAADPAAVPADAAMPAAAPADDAVVPTPPAPRVTVAPYHDKVDRTAVEKRIEDHATRTRQRSAEAEKDVAERARQQGQANSAPNVQ